MGIDKTLTPNMNGNEIEVLAYYLDICREVAVEEEGANPENWDPAPEDCYYCGDSFFTRYKRPPTPEEWGRACDVIGCGIGAS